MTTHICPNCNNQFVGSFCNDCGQKVPHRITIKHITHDILHAFTHTDKGFFHMMIELFKNPGKVAREYIIENKRKRYFTPFQYILIIGTVATIIMTNAHFMEKATQAMNFSGETYSANQSAMMQKMGYYQTKYYTLIILFQLPFLALSTSWLYKKFRFNYAEHLTMNSFISGQTTLLSMLILLSLVFVSNLQIGLIRTAMASIMSISAIYHIIMYMQFFQQRTFKGFLRALMSYLLGFILFAAGIFLIGIIVGSIYIFINGGL